MADFIATLVAAGLTFVFGFYVGSEAKRVDVVYSCKKSGTMLIEGKVYDCKLRGAQ